MLNAPPALQPMRDAPSDVADLICFASGDDRYLSLFAKPLCNSLVRNAGLPFLLHLHAINPSQETTGALADLQAAASAPMAVTCEQTDLQNFDPRQKKVYYSIARFLALPDILRKYRKPVLMVDLDQMIVANLRAAMPAADVGLIRFESAACNILSLFSASVVFAGYTEASLRFFDGVRAYLLERLHDPEAVVWHLDQAALAVAYLSGPDAARFAFFPRDIMHSSSGAEPPPSLPPETVFWSVTFSISENAGNLETALFESFAQ